MLHINFGMLEEECCRASFLRGVFFAGGSITDPQKRYHLELTTSHMQVSRELVLLHAERSVRVAGDGFDYRKDTYHVDGKDH